MINPLIFLPCHNSIRAPGSLFTRKDRGVFFDPGGKQRNAMPTTEVMGLEFGRPFGTWGLAGGKA